MSSANSNPKPHRFFDSRSTAPVVVTASVNSGATSLSTPRTASLVRETAVIAALSAAMSPVVCRPVLLAGVLDGLLPAEAILVDGLASLPGPRALMVRTGWCAAAC